MSASRFEKVDVLYGQVPWYRKRWFMVLTILLFIPATLVITLTGDLYLEKDGEVYKFTSKQKNVVIGVCFILIVLNLMRLLGS